MGFRKRKIHKGLGLLPSPPDPRDYSILQVLQPAVEPLEPIYSDYDDRLPILNQSNTPHCVAYSSAAMKMRQELKEHERIMRFNASWLYAECKKIDGYPEQDGTFIRAAMKILKNQGVPVSYPLGARMGLGYKYKISTYYKVPNDPYTMKLAIKQYGPIVVGYKWKNSWFTPLPGGILPKPDSEAGGHAVLKVGWNDNIVTPEGIGAWECVNSWTKLWGKEGRFYVPYGYEKHMLEAYKAVDMKDVNQGRTL